MGTLAFQMGKKVTSNVKFLLFKWENKKTLSETLIHSNLCDTVRKLPKVCMLRPKDNFMYLKKKVSQEPIFES